MKHLFSLFLVFSLLSSVILFTVSCAPAKEDRPDENPAPTPGGPTDTDDSKIYVPPFKVYDDRRAVRLSSVTYRAPDTDALLLALEEAASLLIANEATPDEQSAKIRSLAPAFSEMMTMSAYTAWKLQAGDTDETLLSEYTRLSEARPRLIQATETLCVAAANSPHADKFAEECFSEDLAPYRDGGKYTDEAVDAMIREAKKEVEYRLLSKANLSVTYEGETDTAEHLLARYRERYGKDSKEFIAASAAITSLYRTEKTARQKKLYTELVLLRREIADALGAGSYAEVAYGEHSYFYTEKQMETLLSDVADNAVDVYRRLYNDVFLSRVDTTPATQKIHKTVNRLSSLYAEKGGVLSEAYNFMLQYSLFDIAEADDMRAAGGGVFYLDAYDSPLLFLSASEDVTDYLALSRAFGSYLGAFRFGVGESEELSAFHSAACELLTLRLLKGKVVDEVYTTLLYSCMENTLLDLINNAFFAAAEARIYALPKEGITEDALDAAVAETAQDFGLSENIDSTVYLLSDATVCAPFTVQSRVVSVLPALQLFFEEEKTPTLGWEKYLSLLSAESRAATLPAVLSAAELENPFAPDRVKAMACSIFYELYGANYNEARACNGCNAA